jgi:hypothetical protein
MSCNWSGFFAGTSSYSSFSLSRGGKKRKKMSCKGIFCGDHFILENRKENVLYEVRLF